MTDQDAANVPYSEEAKAFVAKCFPCEPPCDSYGICSNCAEEVCFASGFNMGHRAGIAHERTKAKELLELLRKIEIEVMPNSRGGTSRGAANRVLALLMDSRAYMEADIAEHRARVGGE